MNGTVLFGVCLVASALYFSGNLLLGLPIGVAVIAYGAFAPSKPRSPSGPRRAPSNDRYV